MYKVGIDIGSTASKVVIMDEEKGKILQKKLMPSGRNSKETGEEIRNRIASFGNPREDYSIVATGYGRVSVPYADKTITEISCHAKGAVYLSDRDITVIDIGGQDTKVIQVKNGMVVDFLMNDKCSAGTGKFLEIMANRLGLSLEEMFDYAARGKGIQISSMCTVFAETEITSLMGKGASREDIAAGVVNSICSKVVSLVQKRQESDKYFLTGGFCDSEYMTHKLSEMLKNPVTSDKEARFAGAIGAALLA